MYVDLHRMDFGEVGGFQTLITTIPLYDEYFEMLYHEEIVLALSNSFPIPIMQVILLESQPLPDLAWQATLVDAK